MAAKVFQTALLESLRRHSGAVAIIYGDRQVTYEQLDRESSRFARRLRDEGFKKGDFIGIFIENRVTFITALIGILRAGCVFVPLDTGLPEERLRRVSESVTLAAVAADKALPRDMCGIKVLDTREDRGSGSLADDEIPYLPEDPIYIYFTSGSTGTPKAILGMNKSLLHFIRWEIETFRIGEGFRVSQLIHTGFDAFLRDVFVPLCAGGVLCIPPDPEILPDSRRLVQWIQKSRVQMVHCVPSVFRLFNPSEPEPGLFDALEYVLLSGEPVPPRELKNWYRVFGPRIQLVNLYGPTETTMTKTFYFIQPTDAERERVPVGKPMKGARIIILDKQLNICADGNFGEIYIRTPFRTHGYYRDDELNRTRFIVNPFTHDANDLFYRTGDMGRVMADGNIELAGRIDRQVKIRGVRIEPEEIEIKLLEYEKIKQAVVTTAGGENNGLSLCAYVVPAGTLDIARVRAFLLSHLPPYMVPQYFVTLEHIPLTPTGKVDWKALPAAEIPFGENIIEPRNEVEQILADIWADVLDINKEKIGIDSGFFELGGHSLNLNRVALQVHKRLNVKLPLGLMFEKPTIRELAAFIANPDTRRETYRSIEPAETRDFYPVSSAQKRLYILQQMDSRGIGLNITELTRLDEGFDDKARIESCFRQLIRRHEALRTSFTTRDDQVVQQIFDDVPFEIEYYHSSKSRIEDFVRPFDLSKAPLFRVGIMQTPGGKDILMADMHHIVSDGVSHYLLVRDFLALYRGETLRELRIQYKDYAVWWNSPEGKETLLRQEAYWLDRFREAPRPLQLPLDFPRPEIQSFEGERIRVEVDAHLTRGLKELAVTQNASLYMVLLAVYNVMLAKVTGQEDIVTATVVSGRGHADLAQVIGPFVNLLSMRNYPTGGKTFTDFLREVRENTIAAFENRDYPFETLVEKIAARRDVSRHPLMDVGFTMQNIDFNVPSSPAASAEEILRMQEKALKFEKKVSKKDMNLEAYEVGDSIHLLFEYCIRLFTETTIRRFSRYFLAVAAAVVENPGQTISAVDIISDEEKEKISAGIQKSRDTIDIQFNF